MSKGTRWLALNESAEFTGQADIGRLRVSIVTKPPFLPSAESSSGPLVGTLFVGDGRWKGVLWGALNDDPSTAGFKDIRLPGPGMRRLQMLRGETTAAPGDEYAPALAPVVPDSILVPRRWSRTIGALGGLDVWRRLIDLNYVLVGVGRTGSLIATTLTRLGISRLTLIDPDRLEVHNLGEMDGVTEGQVGWLKAAAVSDSLKAVAPAREGMASTTNIDWIPQALAHPKALDASKGADVLISCMDNDSGRLVAAIIASLFHCVHVDVGTGIFLPGDASGIPRQREMGADVRLTIPGQGCLICHGSLTRYDDAVARLSLGETFLPPVAWNLERAGSLRTLNQIAAHTAVQMVQDLVAGRLRQSTWVRIEVNEAGRVSVSYPQVMPNRQARNCSLCSRAGLGDLAFAPP